jgi:hypothetical protein
MSAKLYRVTKPVPMWQVVWNNPFVRDSRGRAKRIRKHFLNKEDAEEHLRAVNQQLLAEGAAGVQFDAVLRSDAIAARQWLDAKGHALVTLRQLAERYTAQVANQATIALPIAPEVSAFLEDKEMDGSSEETVKNLKTRLWLWIDLAKVDSVGDITRDCVECLRKRPVAPQTRKNDINAVSNFCTWLVDKRRLDHHPLKGLKRPKVQHGKKPTWTVEECTRVCEAAATIGRSATVAVMILAGPRPSEISATRLIYGRHPLVRIEGGKLKGRANRVIPMNAALRAFLAENGSPELVPVLTRKEREAIRDAAGVQWQKDVHRHTYISHRLQLVRNDGEVAREAGTSEEMIFRHYHGLKTPAEARAWGRLRPGKRLTQRHAVGSIFA